MSTEAMKLALEALEGINSADNDRDFLGPEECCDLDNAITSLQEALAEPATEESLAVQPAAQPQQEPVATLWQQAPIRTTWGDEMMVASVAIDNDHTLSLYCERDQTPKVDAMFAQRKPLTNEEIENILPDDDTPMSLGEAFVKFARAIEAAHGIKGEA